MDKDTSSKSAKPVFFRVMTSVTVLPWLVPVSTWSGVRFRIGFALKK
jgi:hypothetical protein